MFTLDKLLRSNFGFTDEELAPPALVSVDSQAGTLSPHTRNVIVRLSDLFQVGEEVDLIPTASSGRHARFCILQINDDGIEGIAPDGRTGFLPWEMLSYGLSRPALVAITPLDADAHFPDSAISSSRTYYKEQLVREREAVKATENRLQGIEEHLAHSPARGARN